MAKERDGNVKSKETTMLFKKATKALAKPAGLLGAAVLLGAGLLPAQPARAADAPTVQTGPSCGLGNQDYPSCRVSAEDERIAQGFAIEPTGLDLRGKTRQQVLQVAIGAYLLNSAGDCDGCHASKQLGNGGAGGEYISAGNPQLYPAYIGTTPTGGTYTGANTLTPSNPPATINTAGFLAGGSNFGGEFARNLTPDWSTGKPLPEGLPDEATFFKTLRTGHDFQNANAPLAAPANPATLQVMPWPAMSFMTDNDLDALWQYLSAIPCISGTVSTFSSPGVAVIGQTGPVPHDCSKAPPASAYRHYKFEFGQVVPAN